MEKKIQKSISYKIELFDGVRFMASSSSSFTDNLAERIHKM